MFDRISYTMLQRSDPILSDSGQIIVVGDLSKKIFGLYCGPLDPHLDLHRLYRRAGWLLRIRVFPEDSNTGKAWDVIRGILLEYHLTFTKISPGMITLYLFLETNDFWSGNRKIECINLIEQALLQADVLPAPALHEGMKKISGSSYFYYENNYEAVRGKRASNVLYAQTELTFNRNFSIEKAFHFLIAQQMLMEIDHYERPGFLLASAWRGEREHHVVFEGDAELAMQTGNIFLDVSERPENHSLPGKSPTKFPPSDGIEEGRLAKAASSKLFQIDFDLLLIYSREAAEDQKKYAPLLPHFTVFNEHYFFHSNPSELLKLHLASGKDFREIISQRPARMAYTLLILFVLFKVRCHRDHLEKIVREVYEKRVFRKINNEHYHVMREKLREQVLPIVTACFYAETPECCEVETSQPNKIARDLSLLVKKRQQTGEYGATTLEAIESVVTLTIDAIYNDVAFAEIKALVEEAVDEALKEEPVEAKKAVTSGQTTLLVYGGPGSGKSTIIGDLLWGVDGCKDIIFLDRSEMRRLLCSLTSENKDMIGRNYVAIADDELRLMEKYMGAMLTSNATDFNRHMIIEQAFLLPNILDFVGKNSQKLFFLVLSVDPQVALLRTQRRALVANEKKDFAKYIPVDIVLELQRIAPTTFLTFLHDCRDRKKTYFELRDGESNKKSFGGVFAFGRLGLIAKRFFAIIHFEKMLKFVQRKYINPSAKSIANVQEVCPAGSVVSYLKEINQMVPIVFCEISQKGALDIYAYAHQHTVNKGFVSVMTPTAFERNNQTFPEHCLFFSEATHTPPMPLSHKIHPKRVRFVQEDNGSLSTAEADPFSKISCCPSI